MAYFSNSSDGECFDNQCAECIFGELACPIAEMQMVYNYDAVGNKMATEIMDLFVKNDGTCEMLKRFPDKLQIDYSEDKIIALRYKQLLDNSNNAS